MTVIYKCKKCGFTLYRFVHVGQDYYGIPTPSEIMNWYGGVCPKCNERLTKPSISDIVILPIERRRSKVRILERELVH